MILVIKSQETQRQQPSTDSPRAIAENISKYCADMSTLLPATNEAYSDIIPQERQSILTNFILQKISQLPKPSYFATSHSKQSMRRKQADALTQTILSIQYELLETDEKARDFKLELLTCPEFIALKQYAISLEKDNGHCLKASGKQKSQVINTLLKKVKTANSWQEVTKILDSKEASTWQKILEQNRSVAGISKSTSYLLLEGFRSPAFDKLTSPSVISPTGRRSLT